MNPDQLKRKLAAILSADVKGYSRLMGEDEEWTLRTLNAYKETMGSLLQQHQGRIVGTAGDSVLAEFSSVVDAMQCAVEIQQVLKAKNAMLPETRRMEFRIGINLGDVIEEGDSIYGDGVNIAARLEGLADPGGICVSGTAYDQIENKIPLHYDFLGEHEVKNIAKPIRVYRAIIEPEVKSPRPAIDKKPVWKGLSRWAIGLVVIVVIAGGMAFYKFVLLPSSTKIEVASKEKMAFPLPDVPSIAVLPFVNLSGDPKQEFFSDGITEEIITALSNVPSLFVVARTSTYAYKGKPVMVKQVSEELGVRYVLEGSVQRSGDRIRINAQLIDALTGHHLWAEQYDRDLKDLFALQDEITMKILTSLQVKMTLVMAETFRVEKYAEKYYRGKQGIDCYLKIIQAWGYIMRQNNVEDINSARQLLEETIVMCPENPMGYLWLGWVSWFDSWLGSKKSPQESLEKAIKLAQKALAMDDSIANAHSLLGRIYLSKREYAKALAEEERAVALNPGGWTALFHYAFCLTYAGRPEEALPLFQKAIRLCPFGPWYIFYEYGKALWMTGRFEESVSAYKKAIQLAPNRIDTRSFLIVTYSIMGREKEARAEAAEILRISPTFSVDSFSTGSQFKDQSVTDNYISALRKAGLK